jgi:hypothetical protein
MLKPYHIIRMIYGPEAVTTKAFLWTDYEDLKNNWDFTIDPLCICDTTLYQEWEQRLTDEFDFQFDLLQTLIQLSSKVMGLAYGRPSTVAQSLAELAYYQYWVANYKTRLDDFYELFTSQGQPPSEIDFNLLGWDANLALSYYETHNIWQMDDLFYRGFDYYKKMCENDLTEQEIEDGWEALVTYMEGVL